MMNDDGSTTELAAPMMFVGKPGRKIGYVLEDVVWLNIYSTDETDVEKLEGMYLDKSAAWQAHSTEQAVAVRLLSGPRDDAEDYLSVLAEFGFDESTARAQSENTADMTMLPLGSYKIKVGRSRIEGEGLFATAPISAGEVIAPARIGGLRTIAGRYTNHAKRPNAQMVMGPSGDIDPVALADIGGCRGGQDGDEITIDYRQALGLQIKPRSE